MALLTTKECDEAEIKTGQYKMPDGQGYPNRRSPCLYPLTALTLLARLTIQAQAKTETFTLTVKSTEDVLGLSRCLGY